jgi:hypothetical protein
MFLIKIRQIELISYQSNNRGEKNILIAKKIINSYNIYARSKVRYWPYELLGMTRNITVKKLQNCCLIDHSTPSCPTKQIKEEFQHVIYEYLKANFLH